MKDRQELLAFDGISRSVLEARIRQLVTALEAVETLKARVQARCENAARTASRHDDPLAIQSASARAAAYDTVLADIADLLGE